MPVKTRFAPSPTGFLHIGGVRTALYSWAFARRHAGEFLLRIEDTDRERSTDEAIDAIVEGMAWLGLEADAPPVFQTRRFDRYKEVINDMLVNGLAYHCYCSREEIEAMREAARAAGEKPRYDGRCRQRSEPVDGVTPVVRFRNPLDGTVVFDDAVKGRFTFENVELDDLIIARSDGTPTYNFTVVVDDAEMKISHVIRGDDHVNNTPRQINLFRALGYVTPVFAHLPMIHGSDGAKLSKRHGAVSVLEYRKMGILPDALLNYLLRLGWSHGDQEIFKRDEIQSLFDLSNVSRSAANFDYDKLLWVNQQHLMMTPISELAEMLGEEFQRRLIDIESGPALTEVVLALQVRSNTVVEMADKSLCYFEDFEEYDAKAARSHLRPVARDLLAALRQELGQVGDWNAESTQIVVESLAAEREVKMGKIAQPLRVALTGQAASPGIGITLALVGRERTLERLDAAVSFIDKRAASAQ